MGQDGPEAVLYDFLYRDAGRIASYYAQIFGGRLSLLERSSSERNAADIASKLNVALASLDSRSTSETQSAVKRVIDPHDIIAVDVLSYLNENGYIQTDIHAAAHGTMIVAKGTMLFIDRSMVEVAALTMDVVIQEQMRMPRGKRDEGTLQGAKIIKDFVAKLSIPSAFLLQTETGSQIVGTIKDIGMEEPISSYYFKHGTAGLAEVYVIGIKELPSSSFTLPNTQLIGAGQQAAQALSNMLFPADAVRVTPLALFRRI
jgi:hypothetical protein